MTRLSKGQVFTLLRFSYTNQSGGTGLSDWHDPRFSGVATARIIKSWSDYEIGWRAIGVSVHSDLTTFLQQNASPSDQNVYFGEFDIMKDSTYTVAQLKKLSTESLLQLLSGDEGWECNGRQELIAAILQNQKPTPIPSMPVAVLATDTNNPPTVSQKGNNMSTLDAKALARSTRRRYRRFAAELTAAAKNKSLAQMKTKANLEKYGADVLERHYMLLAKADGTAKPKKAEAPKAKATKAAKPAKVVITKRSKPAVEEDDEDEDE